MVTEKLLLIDSIHREELSILIDNSVFNHAEVFDKQCLLLEVLLHTHHLPPIDFHLPVCFVNC